MYWKWNGQKYSDTARHDTETKLELKQEKSRDETYDEINPGQTRLDLIRSGWVLHGGAERYSPASRRMAG